MLAYFRLAVEHRINIASPEAAPLAVKNGCFVEEGRKPRSSPPLRNHDYNVAFGSQLHAGRVDPRVGLGRVRKFTNIGGSGRVHTVQVKIKNCLLLF